MNVYVNKYDYNIKKNNAQFFLPLWEKGWGSITRWKWYQYLQHRLVFVVLAKLLRFFFNLVFSCKIIEQIFYLKAFKLTHYFSSQIRFQHILVRILITFSGYSGKLSHLLADTWVSLIFSRQKFSHFPAVTTVLKAAQ